MVIEDHQPPPSSPLASSVSGDLREAIDKASGQAQTVYLTFLFVAAYVGLTVASTTHRHLLLETRLDLPLLGVTVPLKAFYALAPFLVLIVHFQLILQLFLLARRLHAFEEIVCRADPQSQALIRLLVFPIPFAEMIVGRFAAADVRALVWAAVWWSVFVPAPLLLAATLIWFLPYHSRWLTSWQWVLFVADLALVWRFWPLCVEPTETWSRWWSPVRPRLVAHLVATLVLFGWVTLAAFTPVDVPFAPRNLVLRNLDLAAEGIPPASMAELLAKGLSREQIIAAFAPSAVSLSGRDLRGADLEGAVLVGASLDGASLQHAVLKKADLRDANLATAKLQDANLADAKLHGAKMTSADLTDADLRRAKLYGATLDEAVLEGAFLWDAHLHGVSLKDVRAKGASMKSAQLVGAELRNCELTGAFMKEVVLIAAEIADTDLRGVDLSDAILAGAVVQGGLLSGTTLDFTNLWRTNFDALEEHEYVEGAQLEGGFPADAFETALADVDEIPDAARRANVRRRVFEIGGAAEEDPRSTDKSDPPSLPFPLGAEPAQSSRDGLLTLLAQLSCGDARVARSIARRTMDLPKRCALRRRIDEQVESGNCAAAHLFTRNQLDELCARSFEATPPG